MRLVVYTAIFGGYDKLLAPKHPGRAEYVCLCDNQIGNVPQPWKKRFVDADYEPRKKSRYCKINSHLMFPDADVTIWHGGNVRLTKDPQELVDILGEKDMAAVVHKTRNCIYAEANTVLRLKLDDEKRVVPQMIRYYEENYPMNNGLRAGYLIVRRHTARIHAFNELWWREVDKGSVRDQLSLDYCLWRMDMKPAIIPGGHFGGKHYDRGSHR